MDLVSLTQFKAKGSTEVVLAPISDIQNGAEGCDLGRLREYVEEALHRKAWFVGVGDYVDVGSPSTRQKISAAGLYDSAHAAIESSVTSSMEQIKAILEPTRGRWLGLVSGHHYYDFQDGTNTDKLLAEWLGCEFLGDGGALLEMAFNEPGGVWGKQSIEILLHHGEGSGASPASPLTKMHKLVAHYPSVSIFLIAHYHRKIAEKSVTLRPQWGRRPKLVEHERVIACTGGYLRGYIDGKKANYIEHKMLPPTELGGIFVTIKPNKEGGSPKFRVEY